MKKMTIVSGAETNTDKVLLKILDATGMSAGKKIAHLSLNKPKALNALDLDMVNALLKVLASIRNDESIVAVLLDSEGEKAFCAGGDIVSMHSAMKTHTKLSQPDASRVSPPRFLQDFFTQEYRLDYCIHTFPKPIIVWGNGIIMGGGLGLFAGASIKIVTETARVAMPEISIGLFPDVGGSYFLNKLPKGLGLFLGLTAANINAKDLLAIGMADCLAQHQSKEAFIHALCQLSQIDKADVTTLVHSLHNEEIVTREPNLSAHLPTLARLDTATTLGEAVSILHNICEQADSAYLQKAFDTYTKGSPITAHLVFNQLKRAKDFTLAECFRMELSMAFTCGALGEFEEGVRALLIDKDNQAKWQYAHIDSVDQDVIDMHFSQFDTLDKDAHPLAHLEQEFGV